MKHIILTAIIMVTFSQNSYLQTSKNLIDTITSQIATNNKYESQYIGIAGASSKQYLLYQELKNNATKEELVSLLHHKNPVVRVYSYKALFEKDKNFARQKSKHLQQDTTRFMTLQGCIGGRATVQSFVTGMLHPTD